MFLLLNLASPVGAAKVLSFGPPPKLVPKPLPNTDPPKGLCCDAFRLPKAEAPTPPKADTVEAAALGYPLLRFKAGDLSVAILGGFCGGSFDGTLPKELGLLVVMSESAPKGDVDDPESAAKPEAANFVALDFASCLFEVTSFPTGLTTGFGSDALTSRLGVGGSWTH